MTLICRRVLQAVLYEVVALSVVGPALGLIFDRSMATNFGLAAAMSTIALAWNGVFNALFERWEAANRPRAGRSAGGSSTVPASKVA